MHGLVSPRFPVDAASANALLFILTPNDLGLVDFQNMLVERTRDRLIMRRGGAALTYVPAR